MNTLTASPYWTGTHHGIRYLDPEGNIVKQDPNADGRTLLISHVKETLNLNTEAAERIADLKDVYPR